MKRLMVFLAVFGLLALIGGTMGAAARRWAAPAPPKAQVGPLTPIGTGFTYQGRLLFDNAAPTGSFDFSFTLWDAASGGTQVAGPLNLTAPVSDGLFTVTLDFGGSAFYGEARWLEIAVRATGGGGYTTLSPRQALTPAPAALSAPWFGVSDKPAPYSPLRQANSIAVLDSMGDVGSNPAMTVGADGLSLISYYDYTNNHLKVAHCANTLCSSATTATLDSAPYAGEYSAITLGADGLGLISYYDANNLDLKVAHCANVACTSATIATIDSVGDVGQYTSITLGTDGLGLISYQGFLQTE